MTLPSDPPPARAKIQRQVLGWCVHFYTALGLVAANNSVSYGNYFHMSSGNAYNVIAQILRPGVAAPIEAKFQVSAP